MNSQVVHLHARVAQGSTGCPIYTPCNLSAAGHSGCILQSLLFKARALTLLSTVGGWSCSAYSREVEVCIELLKTLQKFAAQVCTKSVDTESASVMLCSSVQTASLVLQSAVLHPEKEAAS
jgi:hypothetical protein